MNRYNNTYPDLIQNVVFSLDESDTGIIDVSFEYELPRSIFKFETKLSDAVNITTASGFVNNDGRWVWDQSSTELKLDGKYRLSENTSEGAYYVDAGEWAITNAPSQSSDWRYRGLKPKLIKNCRVEGGGIASPDGAVVFLGEHEVIENSNPVQNLMLVLPAASDLVELPSEIFEAIEHTSQYLDVGGYGGEVLMIAAGSDEARWGALGLQSGNSGFWTLDRCRLNQPGSTWIHEYVHTRQTPTFEPSMEWFTEGSACYYAALCSIQLGHISFAEGREFLKTSVDPDAVVRNPETWNTTSTKYTKGRRVVAALDCKIRDHTNNSTDLRDVWRFLNRRYETAGYDEFLTALRIVVPSPSKVIKWTDHYLNGTETPPLPRDPATFGLAQ